MSPTPLDKSVESGLGSVADVNNTSPLLRLPGEIRNRIYEYALQSDDALVFDCCHKFHPSFLPHITIYENSHGHFNELKFACRQLYKETAGLEIRFNRVCFDDCGKHGGPAAQFLRFVERCAAKREGWFRDVKLSCHLNKGVVDSLDESLEPKHVMLALAEFCRKYPGITVNHEAPPFESYRGSYYLPFEDFIVHGLFLSLTFRGKNLSLLDLIVDLDWYKDTKAAATFPVPNLRFGARDMDMDVDFFRKEHPSPPWLRRDACLSVLNDWLANGI